MHIHITYIIIYRRNRIIIIIIRRYGLGFYIIQTPHIVMSLYLFIYFFKSIYVKCIIVLLSILHE